MKHGTATTTKITPRGFVALAVLAILALAVTIAPSNAAAAKADGSVELDVVKRSKAGKRLIRAKIKAGKPADNSRSREGTVLGLPVRNAKVKGNGRVKAHLKGSIVLKGKRHRGRRHKGKRRRGKGRRGRGKSRRAESYRRRGRRDSAPRGKGRRGKRRKVRIKRLTVVSNRRTAIKGKLGRSDLTLFRSKEGLNASPEGDGVVYSLDGAKFSLNRRAAKKLSRKLRLSGKRKLRRGPAGRLTVDLSVKAKTPPTPPANDYPYAAQCPVEPVAGNPGFGDAPGKVSGVAPAPVFTDPQAVSGISLNWGVKTSFRNYVVHAPPSGSLQALDGAVPKPNGPNMAIPGSYWGFPVSGGAYQRGQQADHSDDKVVAEASGTTLFCKPGHGFNVALKNPTVTIDGANSRITADVGVNLNGKWYPFQRADIATLDLSGVTPDPSADGTSVLWKDIPAKVTADGEKATGGIYAAGTNLDPITVKAKVAPEPYPYAAQCPIDSGETTPPGDVDGFQPSPTFTSGTPVSDVDIDWGVLFSFRAYVLGVPPVPAPPPGQLLTLDGAATNPVPPISSAGGSFSFPGMSGEFEEGTADPADDLLVANGSGTVLFCKAGHGFNYVFKDPTITINGEMSRLTISVGSNTFGTWYPFQRVDIAALDMTGIVPAESGNTLTWANIPAELTADGAKVVPANYPAGTALDPLTVEVEVPVP